MRQSPGPAYPERNSRWQEGYRSVPTVLPGNCTFEKTSQRTSYIRKASHTAVLTAALIVNTGKLENPKMQTSKEKDTNATVHFSSSQQVCHQCEKWNRALRLWLKGTEGSGGIHWPPAYPKGAPEKLLPSPRLPQCSSWAADVPCGQYRRPWDLAPQSPRGKAGTVITHTDNLVCVQTNKETKSVEG